MSELLDSGSRREFDSGSVRDLAEGKGRCDLLPLDVVAHVICPPEEDLVINAIYRYVRDGYTSSLYVAIDEFVRVSNTDLFSAVLEAAKQYEDGAKKYAERNWEKGQPLHCFIDSGVRHYLKFRRGDTDEPHDRAFLWNMMSAIWTHDHLPEMIDLPFSYRPSLPLEQTNKVSDLNKRIDHISIVRTDKGEQLTSILYPGVDENNPKVTIQK